MRRSLSAVALAAACAVGLAACGSSGSDGGSGSGGDSVTVAALTSLTGANASTGTQWMAGFKLGLDYFTNGSMEVNGVKINLVESDDQSDANAAMANATDLVSKGATIIAGTQSSDIALGLADFAAQNKVLYIVGDANTDDVTARNEYTFRDNRQAIDDIEAIKVLLGDAAQGKKMGFIASNIEYGKGLVANTEAAFKDIASGFSEVWTPFPADDMAPYVQKIKEQNPDILIPYVSGDVGPLYQNLLQQNMFANRTTVSLIGTRETWPDYAQVPASDKFELYAPYFEGAVDNDLANYLDQNAKNVDYTTADGFNGAQMVVHALEGGTNVDDMISQLEGWKFTSARGDAEIRASDHAFLAPMYTFHFENGSPVLDQTLSADEVAPPEKQMAQ